MKECLLLHTCCAPCLISVYESNTIFKDFDIKTYFFNPNIHPFLEYKKRFTGVKVITQRYKLPLILKDFYSIEYFFSYIHKYSSRCEGCYFMRLESTFSYALQHNIKYISSTLTVSPYQNHEKIKKIGEELSKKYNITFLYYDWRQYHDRGRELAKKYSIYRQQYCGCIFSEEERFKKPLSLF